MNETKILVVDDEELIREMLADVFSEAGFRCLTAGTADEALTVLEEHEIALALFDIMIPGRTGVQLLSEAKHASPETSVIMVTGVANLETAMFCIGNGAEDFLVKPVKIERLMVTARNLLEKRRLRLENRAYQRELEARVREQTSEIRDSMARLQRAYDQTLVALVRALDAREEEVGAHSVRVQRYTTALARALGVPEAEIGPISRGALLHDIGKIGIPNEILLKPAKLTEEEWGIVRKHPEIGHGIVSGIDSFGSEAEFILCHHERFDGSGYPRGLKGKNIPLGARIFAVADAIDAMSSDRPYRKALPFGAVVAELQQCGGTHFDPDVVAAFVGLLSAADDGKEEWPVREAADFREAVPLGIS